MRALSLAVLVLSVALQGCGASEPQPAPERLRGTIVEIQGADAVAGFIVESGKERYHVLIDPERDYGFDLAHLRQHRDTGDPVVVRSERRGDAAYALSIEDA